MVNLLFPRLEKGLLYLSLLLFSVVSVVVFVNSKSMGFELPAIFASGFLALVFTIACALICFPLVFGERYYRFLKKRNILYSHQNLFGCSVFEAVIFGKEKIFLINGRSFGYEKIVDVVVYKDAVCIYLVDLPNLPPDILASSQGMKDVELEAFYAFLEEKVRSSRKRQFADALRRKQAIGKHSKSKISIRVLRVFDFFVDCSLRAFLSLVGLVLFLLFAASGIYALTTLPVDIPLCCFLLFLAYICFTFFIVVHGRSLNSYFPSEQRKLRLPFRVVVLKHRTHLEQATAGTRFSPPPLFCDGSVCPVLPFTDFYSFPHEDRLVVQNSLAAPLLSPDCMPAAFPWKYFCAGFTWNADGGNGKARIGS